MELSKPGFASSLSRKDEESRKVIFPGDGGWACRLFSYTTCWAPGSESV